jgi:hypothetical protein
MSYGERGRHNPYDAYMAGCCIWHSPRQLVLLDERLKDWTPSCPVDAEAVADMREMVAHEAAIKRRKYLGEL